MVPVNLFADNFMSEASAGIADLGSGIFEKDFGGSSVPGADISVLNRAFDYDSSLFGNGVFGFPGESLFPVPADDSE
jgi:hypothetical protein